MSIHITRGVCPMYDEYKWWLVKGPKVA